MKKFMDKDFVLQTKTAKDLFHNHASKMPIIDYHCHLIPQEIAEDKKYEILRRYGYTGIIINGVRCVQMVLMRDSVQEMPLTGKNFKNGRKRFHIH